MKSILQMMNQSIFSGENDPGWLRQHVSKTIQISVLIRSALCRKHIVSWFFIFSAILDKKVTRRFFGCQRRRKRDACDVELARDEA